MQRRAWAIDPRANDLRFTCRVVVSLRWHSSVAGLPWRRSGVFPFSRVKAQESKLRRMKTPLRKHLRAQKASQGVGGDESDLLLQFSVPSIDSFFSILDSVSLCCLVFSCAARNLVLEIPPLAVRFPQRTPSKLIKRPRFINWLRVRCVNHPACNLWTTGL